MKKQVTITLDYEVQQEVRALAEQTERTVSQYINLVLKEHLQKLKEQQK